MFENAKNTKKQGDIGLAYAIAYYSKLGYTVCVPITDSQNYDLIVDTGELILKVQVKTTGSKSEHGVFRVALRTTGGNQSFHTAKDFESSKVDYLFCLTADGDCYSIPTKDLLNTNSLNLGSNMQEHKVALK